MARGIQQRTRLVIGFWERLRPRAIAFGGALAIGTATLTGCSLVPSLPATATGPGALPAVAPAPDCGVPADGERVVILASATAHEPGPVLSGRAEQLLRDAANGDASDGRGAKGSVAVIASTDGSPPMILPLTPRRANCAEEHGLQRNKLIDDNIERVRTAVASRFAHRPGLDLLAGIDDAVRGLEPGVLIIISNGLSTAGGFDLRQVGWHEDPAHLVAQLNQRNLLHDLLPGWQVLITGLGETTGAQPALTKPARDTLIGYWVAICLAAAPSGSCGVDESALAGSPPLGSAEMPVIPVEGVTSAVGPDGLVTDTVSGSVLFAGDSAVLTVDAQVVLRGIVAKIDAKLALQPGLTVTIRGYVADPPASTPQGRQATSDARALAVSEFLSAELASRSRAPRIDAAGAGTPHGTTAVINGVFVEAIASQMRSVTIAY